jgi:hypothetical protein
MANILRTITLTVDPAAAGPLYDVYYSTDCINYTICTDGSSVSLPTVGSTANVTFPDTTACIKLINLSSGCGANFVVETIGITLDYLVVAAGGGGGLGSGGGGGAGGLKSGSITTNFIEPLTISVAGESSAGTNGGNSFISASTLISALGGGFGGYGSTTFVTGSVGGSGGGGSAAVVGTVLGSSGSVGQGNKGGTGVVTGGTSACAGGGGGATTQGQNGTPGIPGKGGDGGAGSQWLDGNYYAGGGGGSYSRSGDNAGLGGIGGGGRGAADAVAATAGSPNTGGGGGGGNASGPYVGRDGGSGVVKLRYLSTYTANISGLTASTVTSGSYKITSFTAGSGTVTFS